MTGNFLLENGIVLRRRLTRLNVYGAANIGQGDRTVRSAVICRTIDTVRIVTSGALLLPHFFRIRLQRSRHW